MGVAIIVVAALFIAAIVLRERIAPAAAPALPAAPAAATPGGSPNVRATGTANVYAWPDRAAEVTAILPAGSEASLHGRSEDGEWLLIAYPAGATARGWARAVALGLGADAVAALPTAIATAAPGSARRDGVRALPDIVLAEALLLQGGRLAVGLRNLGAAPLTNASIALHVSTLAGELVGVLRIGPTTLAPGSAATIVTPLTIDAPGSYRLELDPANEIAESQDGNNSLVALLVPLGS
ncbi:MAG: hypothetical protein EXR63_03740 [Dehalococcoidia bacterium]|nr:hypothetical protein [Dehalococcoidia bacterium]